MSIAIDIQGLTKYYRKFRALNHISLQVKEGEFFGFLGPNGAGKTTTISVMTGLANYQEGKVKIFGHDVTREYRKARALIGLVPQEFNVDPFLSIEQILIYEAGYFGIPKPEARKRANELLNEFDLVQFRKLDFRKLSGGLKRRLLIARALVHKPKILIVDEPTAGLDLELRHRLWDFFKETNQKGITIFLTTHYIEEAEKLCNRIGVISGGVMIEVDDKIQLMKRLGQTEIAIHLSQKIEAVPEGLSDLGVELTNGGSTLYLRGDVDKGFSKLLKSIHAHGVDILDVHVKRATLEEVFFRLTHNRSHENRYEKSHRF
jgi:ABC-2 type transport system ATP-binding protein